MIILVSGLPGAGKSLNAIKRYIAPALKAGRKVWSNIDGLNLLRLSIYCKQEPQKVEKLLRIEEFSTQKILDTAERNSLLVIDEAQQIWGNRDYKTEENKQILSWLQKHRHYGIDVVFLTQNIDQLDIGIRRLCGVHYRIIRLTNVGLSSMAKVNVFPDAMGSEQFRPLAVESWDIDKRIFTVYDSYEDASVSESKSRISIWKSKKLWFAVGVVTLCIYIVSRQDGIGSIFGNAMRKTSGTETAAEEQTAEWIERYCVETGDTLFQLTLTDIDTVLTACTAGKLEKRFK